MPLRIALGASAVAVLLALPAAADAAGAVRPSSVSARVTVPAGGARAASLHCPGEAVAVSGAVSRKGAGVTLRHSRPGSGPADWHFRLSAAAGSTDRGATLVLRCVRLAQPRGVFGARLVVKTQRRPGIAVPAGGTASVRVSCGRAWLATGYGIEVGRSTGIRLAGVVPRAHAWAFTIENTGSRSATVTASARCLRQSVDSTRGTLRFRASRPTQRNTFAGGRVHAVSHSCGTGRFSLATGSIVDPAGSLELDSSGPVRAAWGRWTFRRGSGEALTILLCLSRASRFE
jgi:hypothetical protein